MSKDTAEKSDSLRCYGVGDELAFRCGSHAHWWEIHKITKISPTGRITCGRFVLNPDLTIRGRAGWHGPYAGEPVTAEVEQDIQRNKHLRLLKDTKWDQIADEKLSQIVRIVQSP